MYENTLVKKNDMLYLKRLLALVLAIAIVLTTLIVGPFSIFANAAEETGNGVIDFGNAAVNYDSKLNDNGDGTYSLTLDLYSSTGIEDKSTSKNVSSDGYFEVPFDGEYLVKLWGGDGGEGAASLVADSIEGGKGGYVYGVLSLKKGDIVLYKIGGNGDTTIKQDEGGGANGDGGAHGEKGNYKVGGGGGYSAIYLFSAGTDADNFYAKYTDADKNLINIDDDNFEADRTSRYVMIAAGGGGSGAGSGIINAIGSWIKGKERLAQGGIGGTMISSTPIEVADGYVYAGADGKSSGDSLKYVGKGGSDVPGVANETLLSWSESTCKPNDWFATENVYLPGGRGGSGNFRGGAGGAGYTGGSGGIQTSQFSATNVGGGGGGASYISKTVYANNETYATAIASYNVNSSAKPSEITTTNGGCVSINYLGAIEEEGETAEESWVNDISIDATLSDYFDIASIKVDVTDAAGNTTSLTSDSANYSDYVTITGKKISLKKADIAKGCSAKYTITVKPVDGFAGGNDVPIFKDSKVEANSNSNKAATETIEILTKDSLKYVNVPLDLEAHGKTVTIDKGDSVATTNLFDQTEVTTLATKINNDPLYSFLASVTGYYITGPSIDGGNATPTSTSSYDVYYTVKPKAAPSKATVGTAIAADGENISAVSTINVNDPSSYTLFNTDGDASKKSISVNRTLTYNEADDTYTLAINLTGTKTYQKPVSFTSATYTLNSSSAQQVSVNGTATTTATTFTPPVDGWYYIQSWGGNGGEGQAVYHNQCTGQAGKGGIGGYVSEKVYLKTTDTVTVSVGKNGANGSVVYGANENGSYTKDNVPDMATLYSKTIIDTSKVLSSGNSSSNKLSGYKAAGGQGGFGGIGSTVSIGSNVILAAAGAGGGGGGALSVNASNVSSASKVATDSAETNTTSTSSGEWSAYGGYSVDNSNVSTTLGTIDGANGSNGAAGQRGNFYQIYALGGGNKLYSSPAAAGTNFRLATVNSKAVSDISDGSYTSSNYSNNGYGGAVVISFAASDTYTEAQARADFEGVTISGTLSDYFKKVSGTGNDYSFSVSATDNSTSNPTGYTLTTSGNNWVATLDKTFEITFKATDAFLGGYDVPVNSGNITLSQKISESKKDSVNIKSDSTTYATDYANVKMKSISNAITANDMTITKGDSVTITGSTNAALFNKSGFSVTPNSGFNTVTENITNSSVTAPVKNTTYTLTETLKPTASSAAKAKVGPAVVANSVVKNATVTVQYSVTVDTANTTGVTITPSVTKLSTLDNGNAKTGFSAQLVAESGYELPTSVSVKVDGVDYDNFTYDKDTGILIVKSDATKYITGNVTLAASASEKTFKVSYLYSVSTDNKKTREKGPYTGIVAGTEQTFEAPSDLPAAPFGYTYVWDTGDVEVSGGKFTMPKHDVSFIGSYQPIEYKIKVNYVDAENSNAVIKSATYDGILYGYEGTLDLEAKFTQGSKVYVMKDLTKASIPLNVNQEFVMALDENDDKVLEINVEYIKATAALNIVYKDYTTSQILGVYNYKVGDKDLAVGDNYNLSTIIPAGITAKLDAKYGTYYTPYIATITGDNLSLDGTLPTSGTMESDGVTETVYMVPNKYNVSFVTNTKVEGTKVEDAVMSGTLTVAYDGNFGTAYASTSSFDSTIKYMPTPSKLGYTFKGWYATYNDSTGAFSNPVDETTLVADVINSGTITLYAKWEKSTYKVNFIHMDEDGNILYTNTKEYTWEGSSKTVNYDFSSDADYLAALKGYIYKALANYTPASGTTVSATSGSNGSVTITTAGNRNVFLTYEKGTYDLSFNLDGGTCGGASSIPTEQHKFKSDVTVPTGAMAKTDYEFAGWYLDSGFTSPVSSTFSMPGENSTLYAKWVKNGNLEVTVVDKNDLPIKGATVTLKTGTTATTNAQGIALFEDVAAGSYTVKAEKGTKNNTADITYSLTNNTLTIKLNDYSSTTTISGIVEDEENEPVKGAIVKLIDNSTSPATVIGEMTTGFDGKYEFKDVPEGKDYEIQITLPGSDDPISLKPVEVEDEKVTDKTKPIVGTDYVSGTWSNDTVTINLTDLAQTLGTTTYKYQVWDKTLKDGAGDWGSDVAVSGTQIVFPTTTKIRIYATSGSGVLSDPKVVQVNVDKDAPSLSTTYDSSKYVQSGDINITVSDTDSGLAKLEFGTWNSTKSQYDWETIDNSTAKKSVSANGKYAVRATDNVGRTSMTEEEVSNIDTTKPSLSMSAKVGTTAYDGSWTNKDVVVTLTDTGSSKGTSSFYYKKTGDTDWTKIDNDSGEAKKATLTISSACDTTYYFIVKSEAGVSDTDNKSQAVKIDKTAPTGTIKLGGVLDMIQDFVSTITFGLYKNDDVSIVANVTDEASGLKSLGYYVVTGVTSTSDYLTKDELDAVTTWDTTLTKISKDTEQSCIVYAKAIDNAGNVRYFAAENGIVIDTTKPVITVSGDKKTTTAMNSESTAYGDRLVTFSDTYLDTVTVSIDGGTATNLTAIEMKDGYSIDNAAKHTYVFVATDKAGNQTTKTITVDTVDQFIDDLDKDWPKDDTQTPPVLNPSKEQLEDALKEIDKLLEEELGNKPDEYTEDNLTEEEQEKLNEKRDELLKDYLEKLIEEGTKLTVSVDANDIVTLDEDDIKDALKNEFTTDDAEVVLAGGTVNYKLVFESKAASTANGTAISTANQAQIKSFNAKLVRTVTDKDSKETSTDIYTLKTGVDFSTSIGDYTKASRVYAAYLAGASVSNTVDTTKATYTMAFASVKSLGIYTLAYTPDTYITGKVTDENDKPLPGVTVELLDKDGKSFDPKVTTTTDTNGDYSFGPLPDGDYQVSVTIPKDTAGTPADLTETNDVTVTPGGNTTPANAGDIKVDGYNSSGSLTVTVKDSDGNIIKKATVTLKEGTSTSVTNGVAVFERVKDDTYTVTATANGKSGSYGPFTRTDDEPAAIEVVITGYNATTTISGIVTDDDGKPVEGAKVTLWDTSTDPATKVKDTVTTGPDGKYKFEDVPEGDNYKLEIEYPDSTKDEITPVKVFDGDVTDGADPVLKVIAKTADDNTYTSDAPTNQVVNLKLVNTTQNIGTDKFQKYDEKTSTWVDITGDTLTFTPEAGKETVETVHLRAVSESGKVSVEEVINVRLDAKAATGEIGIGTTAADKFQSFIETITFGIYKNKNLDVAISATDTNGIDKIYYLIKTDGTSYDSLDAIKAATGWTEYNDSAKPQITAADESKAVAYAKIVDKGGNVTYLSTDGIVFDTTAPSTGVSSNKDGVNSSPSTGDRIVTITDNHLKTVVIKDHTGTVIGTITLDEDNETYTVVPSPLPNGLTATVTVDKDGQDKVVVYIPNDTDETYTIEATDRAGGAPTAPITVDINTVDDFIDELDDDWLDDQEPAQPREPSEEEVKDAIKKIDDLLKKETTDGAKPSNLDDDEIQELLNKKNELNNILNAGENFIKTYLVDNSSDYPTYPNKVYDKATDNNFNKIISGKDAYNALPQAARDVVDEAIKNSEYSDSLIDNYPDLLADAAKKALDKAKEEANNVPVNIDDLLPTEPSTTEEKLQAREDIEQRIANEFVKKYCSNNDETSPYNTTDNKIKTDTTDNSEKVISGSDEYNDYSQGIKDKINKLIAQPTGDTPKAGNYASYPDMLKDATKDNLDDLLDEFEKLIDDLGDEEDIKDIINDAKDKLDNLPSPLKPDDITKILEDTKDDVKDKLAEDFVEKYASETNKSNDPYEKDEINTPEKADQVTDGAKPYNDFADDEIREKINDLISDPDGNDVVDPENYPSYPEMLKDAAEKDLDDLLEDYEDLINDLGDEEEIKDIIEKAKEDLDDLPSPVDPKEIEDILEKAKDDVKQQLAEDFVKKYASETNDPTDPYEKDEINTPEKADQVTDGAKPYNDFADDDIRNKIDDIINDPDQDNIPNENHYPSYPEMLKDAALDDLDDLLDDYKDIIDDLDDEEEIKDIIEKAKEDINNLPSPVDPKQIEDILEKAKEDVEDQLAEDFVKKYVSDDDGVYDEGNNPIGKKDAEKVVSGSDTYDKMPESLKDKVDDRINKANDDGSDTYPDYPTILKAAEDLIRHLEDEALKTEVVEENDPGLDSVKGMDDLFNNPKAFDEEDQKIIDEGGKIVFQTIVVKETVTEVEAAEMNLLNDTYVKKGIKAIAYFNITLVKKTYQYNPNTGDYILLKTEYLTDISDGALEYTFNIPENFWGYDEYYIIRVHDGKSEIIATAGKGSTKITAKTDKFSTYVLAYKDPEAAANTNDSSPIGSTIALLASSGLCVVAIAKKKKEDESEED